MLILHMNWLIFLGPKQQGGADLVNAKVDQERSLGPQHL